MIQRNRRGAHDRRDGKASEQQKRLSRGTLYPAVPVRIPKKRCQEDQKCHWRVVYRLGRRYRLHRHPNSVLRTPEGGINHRPTSSHRANSRDGRPPRPGDRWCIGLHPENSSTPRQGGYECIGLGQVRKLWCASSHRCGIDDFDPLHIKTRMW